MKLLYKINEDNNSGTPCLLRRFSTTTMAPERPRFASDVQYCRSFRLSFALANDLQSLTEQKPSVFIAPYH